MKTFLMLLGAVFALILILVVLIAVRGTALEREGKAYADASIVSIVSNWSEQALLDRASPAFMQKVSKAQIDSLFARLRPLGRLSRYNGAKGMNIFSTGTTTTATYVAKADFEHGRAQISISLIKQNGSWRILGFYVQGNGAPSRTTLNLPRDKKDLKSQIVISSWGGPHRGPQSVIGMMAKS